MKARLYLLSFVLLCGALALGQTSPASDDQTTSPAPPSAPPNRGHIAVSPPCLRVDPGKNGQFAAQVTGATNAAVTWSISGPGCAGTACGTISVGGLYTAPTNVPVPPIVKITAASNDGTSATATVNLAERVFRVGPGVTPPRVIHSPDPEYSQEARNARYQGTCVLRMVVGSDGRPRDIKIVSAVGHGLDEKAVESVRQWRFHPATRNGEPVATQISVEVTFRMSGGNPLQQPPPLSELGAPFESIAYTDAELHQIHALWDRDLSDSKEVLRLRAECLPYVSLSLADLRKKQASLPPHECAAVLRWMRDLRVEVFYVSNQPCR
jgi:TonB family protein